MEPVTAAVARAAGLSPADLRAEPLDPSGEALALVRLVSAEDPPRRWVAKRLHPALRREAAAYRGPLAGRDLAPRLAAEVEDRDGRLWIVLEDAGRPLAGRDPADWLEEVAALAARIHDAPAAGLEVPFWRRRVHVRHGFRHLSGEWRIALDRVEAGVRAGVIENDAAPTDAEARRVLDEAWSAMAAGPDGLVHGDFQPPNLLRAADGVVRAVDWSRWGAGSPLVDLVSTAMDLTEEQRDRFLSVYLDRRGRSGEREDWRERLARAVPLRQLLGLGVLAHYAARGLHPRTVANSLPRRLDAWNAARSAPWT